MTTETTPCVHTARQQETRVLEAVLVKTGAASYSYLYFRAIQQRTGIPPVALQMVLDGLIASGKLRRGPASPFGSFDDSYGFPPGSACPHDPAFQAMETTVCPWCSEVWP